MGRVFATRSRLQALTWGMHNDMQRKPAFSDESPSQALPFHEFVDVRESAVAVTPEFHTVGYEEFSPDVASVAEVRRFVRHVVEGQDLNEDSVTGCELIADELATNALSYTGSFYSVLIEQSDETVRIGVRDDSRVLPVLRQAAPDSESGRGLCIVSETSSDWGTESLGLGKETWADIATEPHSV